MCDLVLPPAIFYPLVSLRSSSSCLPLLPCLPVTCILPYSFPSIMCLRRQFVHTMWPNQLPFILFSICRIFVSYLPLCNPSLFLTRSVQMISILLQYHISKISRYKVVQIWPGQTLTSLHTNSPGHIWTTLYFWSTFRSVQVSAPYSAMLQM
jgi:hypothetical protein